MYACIGLISPHVNLCGIIPASHCLLNILRQINNDHTRFARTGNVKCFFDDRGKILTPAHCDCIFANAPCNANDIYLLKGIIADQMRWHLSGKTDKRHTVIICRGNSCGKIGSSGTAGHQTNAHFSRGARVTVRRVNQALFVARENDPDFLNTIQCVKQINCLPAGVSKQRVNLFFQQCADNQFRSCDLHRNNPSSMYACTCLHKGLFDAVPPDDSTAPFYSR